MKTRSPRKQRISRNFRPWVEQLEARDVPAAPVIDQLTTVAPFIPAGKSIFIPITATDPQGQPLSFSVTSSNSAVTATVEPVSNQFLKISVAGFGDMVFELFGDLAPDTVGRLTGLVQSGFFNGLTFHRVASGFVIQGGDPLGNGTGGPGFSFSDEFNSLAIFSGKGELAMANSGRDTNGSQFFVTLGSPRSLDFIHNIWGQLVRGFDVLQAINNVPTTPAGDGMPNTPVVITNMSLIQDNHDAVVLLKTTATTGSSVITVTAQNTNGEKSAPMSFSATVMPETTNDPAFLNPIQTNLSTPENTPLTFTVSAIDLENDPLTFNATSTSSNATVSVVGNQITVTPVNNFVGPIPVTISVMEAGQAKPDTQTVIVGVGPRKLTAVSGTPFTGTEAQALSSIAVGSFTDTAVGAAVGDYTVSINWGDGHVTSGSLAKGAGGVFTVSGTNTYAQAGRYPVNVTITLNSSLGGNVATFATTAFISEATLTSQGVAVSSTAGQSLSNIVVATVQDANPNPILATFSAMIDWGDGSQPTPGVIQRAANGTIQVLGSHSYTSAGNFLITTTVRDSNSAGSVEDGVTTATASATIAAPQTPTIQQLTRGYVAGLYRTDLRREANANEINFWNAVLNLGVTRFQVAYDIEISPEHRLLQIGDMYTKFLLRSPTLQEKLDGLTSLQNGDTLEQLKARILASDEYFRNRASSDQTTLLQVLGIDVTGAMLPTAEMHYYTWVFSTTAVREEAVLSLLHSQVAEVAAIKEDYQGTLGRAADVGGAAQALELRKGGATDDAIRALLFSSDEGFLHLNAPAFTETITG
jgi:cyclophilin family peptidyl-prolyl cis-trans isomerase